VSPSLTPGPHPYGGGSGYLPLKRGLKHWAVMALQVNLGVTVDGDFGAATEHAVKAFQAKHGLKSDGVAGVVTQRRIVAAFSATPNAKHGMPSRLMESIAQNESGFWLAAFAPHPSDGGFDLGAFQQSFPTPGTRATYLAALEVIGMAERTAAKLAERYAAFVPRLHDRRRAWELAVLSHNWPTAADNLSRTGHVYKDPSRDNHTEAWIVTASRGRLHTPLEWVNSYIARATLLVDWNGA
jgi:hypothetical protein